MPNEKGHERNESALNAVDIEATIARHTVRRAVFVGPPLIALFWVFRGSDGAIGASIGVAVIVGNFLLSGWILSLAARFGLTAYHAAALFGFVFRLLLITGTMFGIVAFMDLDRLAFGITAVATYLALLVLESIHVLKGGERELEWTQ